MSKHMAPLACGAPVYSRGNEVKLRHLPGAKSRNQLQEGPAEAARPEAEGRAFQVVCV